MKQIFLVAVLALSALGAQARADSFTVGASFGAPYVEVRAGYETPDLGARAYLAYGWFLGADAYVKIGQNEWDSAFRIGVGAGYAFGTGLADGPILRGVVGGQVFLAPSVFLTLEWRPTLFLGPRISGDVFADITATIVGFITGSVGLEYHF